MCMQVHARRRTSTRTQASAATMRGTSRTLGLLLSERYARVSYAHAHAHTHTKARTLAHKHTDKVLRIFCRMINVPLELAHPLHKTLHDELDIAADEDRVCIYSSAKHSPQMHAHAHIARAHISASPELSISIPNAA